jgi:tetraprenyl-beta-curcumene synthase
MAVAAALGAYLTTALRPARRELRRWEDEADSIPDPVLRAQALAALAEKGLNVEAVAVFATLAPRAYRRRALGAIATLQIAIDYIDSLSEGSTAEPLEDGLRLHQALAVALTPGAEPLDWYRFHPRADDGGYLSRLVASCQESVRSLPAATAVLPLARAAASRCGEGQSYTHAAARGEVRQLQDWADGLDSPAGYRWWEVAAGASSSVAAHALIAAAADRETSAGEAALIDAAYFPPIGALTVLLDDLIDREEDALAGEHNYLTYYRDSQAAADRLALIAARASAATAKLRDARRHAAILSGVAGFYLSADAATTPYARPIRDRLLGSIGLTSRPLLATMRLRRRI